MQTWNLISDLRSAGAGLIVIFLPAGGREGAVQKASPPDCRRPDEELDGGDEVAAGPQEEDDGEPAEDGQHQEEENLGLRRLLLGVQKEMSGGDSSPSVLRDL